MTVPFPLVAIADRDFLGENLVEAVCRVTGAGIPWICLRARRSTSEERIRWARELLARCPGVFLTVHGDPEACRASGAPGLHLPGLPAGEIARIRCLLPGVLLGVSCHNRWELLAAARSGADYAFLSPVFPPASKRTGRVLGPEGFRKAAAGVRLAVYALGGVTPERLSDVAVAGAQGAALLGALFGARDLEARARAYLEAVERVFGVARRGSGSGSMR